MKWSQLPEPDDISQLLQKEARQKATVRGLEHQIKSMEAEISLKYPRNTAHRQLGTLEFPISVLRDELLKAEEELDVLQAHIKFVEYQLTVWRTLSYKERA